MALSKTVLGPLLKSKIDALSDNDKRDRDMVFEAMADAIITHIVSAGLVTVVVASVTGVTPGGGASGPGTGTGTIS